MFQLNVINDIGNFFKTVIDIIKDTFFGVIEFIKTLIEFIPNCIDFLPENVKVIFIPIIIIIVGIFIYRFVR